jgi:alkylation response protein AidB-like acyl-CoA dehydrogenase
VAGLHGGLGHGADALANNLTSLYFDWRKATIYGGTTEVQKNIVAKQVLGL